MNSPYMGDFKVTQEYKGMAHDGLDLVGLNSKEIHSTVNGVVTYAGWENPNDHSQGFGQYVCILKDGTNDYYYYGHMSKINVVKGQKVKTTDVIGVEGSTGHSTGSHCHYCCREKGIKALNKDINAISGIPNALGVYNDGYVPYKDKNQSGTDAPKKASPAQSFDKTISGTYKATTAVNMRSTPGVLVPSNVLTVIQLDEKVHCYGYYTNINETKWLYVQKGSTIGFVCSKYFKKM